MPRTKVLLVDDDKTVVRIMTMLLAQDRDIHVVGAAHDGREALGRIPELHPDVVILDIEMPVMDGLDTMAVIHERHPNVVVIMFSTFTHRGASQTLQALARGASDYVAKPTSGMAEARETIRSLLLPKIKALVDHRSTQVMPSTAGSTQPTEVRTPKPPVRGSSIVPEVLVIGASTGGPQALGTLFTAIPESFPIPILMVQHMAPMFTRLFAERLTHSCALPVAEGKDGDTVEAGRALLAPGDYHMTLAGEGERIVTRLNQNPPENFCRPSVDPLFVSAAGLYGQRVLAVILTGMGEDGLRGSRAVRDAGGEVLVQDQATSVVWGMPGAVAKVGIANDVLPIDGLIAEILARAGARSAVDPNRARASRRVAQ